MLPRQNTKGRKKIIDWNRIQSPYSRPNCWMTNKQGRYENILIRGDPMLVSLQRPEFKVPKVPTRFSEELLEIVHQPDDIPFIDTMQLNGLMTSAIPTGNPELPDMQFTNAAVPEVDLIANWWTKNKDGHYEIDSIRDDPYTIMTLRLWAILARNPSLLDCPNTGTETVMPEVNPLLPRGWIKNKNGFYEHVLIRDDPMLVSLQPPEG